MLQHKRTLAGILAATMMFSLTACGGGGATTDQGSDAAQDPNEAAAAGTLQLSEWEESSGIFNTDETDEELYEKAKEEGKVTIYSISSRITKVANAFMEKYPGIEVEPFDISTNELLEKVTREYDAGQHVADVVHIKDQDGTLYNEYILPRKFYNYKPADILSHIDEKYTKTQTPMYVELTQLFYNSEAYPDGSPVTNIWQLPEPDWKGRVMMQNPLDNLAWGSWITGFCVGDVPDELAASYKELYGKELTLSDGCENAGYEFLKRLHANEPIFTASSDAIAEAVGTPGQKDPPVGFCASSKLRKARQNYQNVLPYFTRMRDTISRVVPHLPDEPEHPFFHERDLENPKRAYIVLTADKGMAGAYNQNLLKFLREHADQNDRFYVIGQVGYRALFRKDPRLVEDFHYGATAPTLQRARDITVDAIDDFKSGKLDEIYIVYTKIQNALTSEPVMERLLPLDRAHLTPAPKGLGDPRGEVEMFPDAWTVFEQTAPIYMHGMIFGAMTESFCAEQSARMTAMDSATKSAKDMIHDLELEYNRSRQGSITQEITEIIGGAAAVQSSE